MFKQCTRCGDWICEPVCFNRRAQLCEGCAPDLDEEIAAAQAEAAREQAHEKARQVDGMKGRDLGAVTGAACGACGAKVGKAKFCPECGTPTAPAKRCCQDCGGEIERSPRFRPECGTKLT